MTSILVFAAILIVFIAGLVIIPPLFIVFLERVWEPYLDFVFDKFSKY